MKKIAFLLSVLLLSFSLSFAGTGCRVDTIMGYTYDAGSTIKKISGMSIYKFDGNDNKLEDYRLSWNNSTSSWSNVVLYTSTFNVGNKKTSFFTQYWVSGAWQNATLDSFFYDGNNLLIKDIDKQWNTTGPWTNQYLNEYAYNTNGDVIEDVGASWNTGTATWDYTNLGTYSYNSDNLLVETVQQENIAGSWQNGLRYTNVYSGLSLLTSTTQSWTGTAWINFAQIEKVYLGFVAETIFKQWNTVTSSWRNTNKSNETYSSTTGLLESTNSFLWNTTGGAWDQTGRELYTYITNTNIDQKRKQIYNTVSLLWQNTLLTDYNYNTDDDLTETLLSNWNVSNNGWDVPYDRLVYEYNPDRLVAEDRFRTWNSAANYYNEHTRFEYLCAGVTVGINDISATVSFSIYPNPVTSNNATINSAANTYYTLFDITGKTIQTGNLNIGENRIQLSQTAAGIYLFKVGNQTQKIVIQ